jgi:hypothetical protein
MVEFKLKNCDPIQLNKDCSELPNCVQRGVALGGCPWLVLLGNMVEELVHEQPIFEITAALHMMLQLALRPAPA